MSETAFIFTIDTEGDHLRAGPRGIAAGDAWRNRQSVRYWHNGNFQRHHP